MDCIDQIVNSDEFKNSKINKLENYYCYEYDEKLDLLIKSKLSDIRKEISESLRMDNVCILTGNGSSIYAGTKDTTTFSCYNYFDMTNSNEKIIYDSAVASSIEKVLNNLIVLLNYYSLIKNNEMMDLILIKIKEIEDDFIINNVEAIDYNTLTFHEIIARKCKKMEILNKLSIYTLNYDLAFEYTFDKLGIDYNNGFSGFINRTFDGSGLENRKNIANVVKLHGSLNWYIDDNGYDIKERQPNFDDGCIIHEEKPYLIYPTSNKFIDSQNYPFSELLRNFMMNVTSKKTVLFIIGYKYEDTHVNDALRKALLNPNIIIYAFNYKASNSFLDELKALSKIDERIHYFDEPFISDFRTFANYLMPSVNNKDDMEIIRDILSGVSK